jgi:hypothetical protein
MKKTKYLSHAKVQKKRSKHLARRAWRKGQVKIEAIQAINRAIRLEKNPFEGANTVEMVPMSTIPPEPNIPESGPSVVIETTSISDATTIPQSLSVPTTDIKYSEVSSS